MIDNCPFFLIEPDFENSIHTKAVMVTQHSRIKAKGIAPSHEAENLNKAYVVPQNKDASKAKVAPLFHCIPLLSILKDCDNNIPTKANVNEAKYIVLKVSPKMNTAVRILKILIEESGTDILTGE
ncbi:MAG: hypothetical protein V9F46_13260 [Chitinophagaceae bacterium]